MTMTEPKPVYRAGCIDAREAARIEAMYAEGYEMTEIAAAVGRTRQGVSRHLIAAGVHIPTAPRASTPEERRRAVDWYARGVPVSAIQRRFGMGSAALYNELQRAGIPLRRGKVTKQVAL